MKLSSDIEYNGINKLYKTMNGAGSFFKSWNGQMCGNAPNRYTIRSGPKHIANLTKGFPGYKNNDKGLFVLISENVIQIILMLSI